MSTILPFVIPGLLQSGRPEILNSKIFSGQEHSDSSVQDACDAGNRLNESNSIFFPRKHIIARFYAHHILHGLALYSFGSYRLKENRRTRSCQYLVYGLQSLSWDQ